MAKKAMSIIEGNSTHPNLRGQACFCSTLYGDCTAPYDKTGNHYNPDNSIHPFHSGDLPPLLSIDGDAGMKIGCGVIEVEI